MKAVVALMLMLALTLAACGPDVPAVSTSATSAPSTSTLVEATAMPATVAAITAVVGTAYPGVLSTPLANLTPEAPPTVPLATLIPTLPSGVGPTELKYQVLSQFPNLFFCDPDSYPVARGDETELARQHFPEIQANPEEFRAILKHTGLAGSTTFTDAQTLLIYQEHKKLNAIQFELAGDSYHFQLKIADSKNGFLVDGLVDSQGVVTVQKQDPVIATCPICLAADTRIDTPNGPVAVRDLRMGDLVWSVDASGARVRAVVLKTARVAVPATHQMVHVVLQDGRELWASPNHPTADGHALGALKLGDVLNGARIVRLERVPYHQAATYDLLPSGGTGFYWANGILMGSTLANP